MIRNTFGAIDIGSNAIRLLVNYVECNGETEFKKAAFLRVPIRLGEDVFTDGRIGKEKLALLEEAMQGFSSLMRVFGVQSFRACATSAMREAVNGEHVVNRILDKTGIRVDIISGQEEAELIFEAGDAVGWVSADESYLYVDVGGGSTEATVYSNRKRATSESFSLGTVRMISGATKEEEAERFRRWLKGVADTYRPVAIVGSGGNINKVFKMLGKKEREPLRLAEVKSLFSELGKLSYDERVAKCGLNAYRADVILPALEIFLTAARTCRIDKLIVPRIGLVDGIIHHLYRQSL